MKNVLFIFGQLTDEDVQWLARQGEVVGVAGDQVLIREGEPIEDVYVTLEGEFVVARDREELARIGAGEMLGEMSFLEQSRPSADVLAATFGKVLKIRREVLKRRLDEDEGFAGRFYRGLALTLSARLRDADEGLGTRPRSEGVLEPDELDPEVMDSVSQAGDRFTLLLRDVRG